MRRSGVIVYNICFALNCLLVFLLLFDSRVQVPTFLQVAGRMHPLFLHFPIVLFLLAIGWETFPRSRTAQDLGIGNGLMLVTAFTAVLTSLMGFFLSKEPGYDMDLIQLHKWGGLLVSLLAFFWYAFRRFTRKHPWTRAALAFGGLSALLITGHQGASLTHGAGFLAEPLVAAYHPEAVLLEDAEVFSHLVQPILENKCAGCHNPRKTKGELLLTSYDDLLKGGKSGKLWDSTEADYGLLLRRLHLPLSQKKHMPPQGKPQLEDDEIEIIARWIRSGALPATKVVDLPEKDTLRMIASKMFGNTDTEIFDFTAAAPAVVEKLNNNYRVIKSISLGSPALEVSFFSPSQFRSEQLKELSAIKNQIVRLNLKGMPVNDADLQWIAQFTNLRKLQLSFTQITDAGLPQLARLKSLKHLSLSGTNTGKAFPALLAQLPQLKKVELWQTRVQNPHLKKLAASFTGLKLEGGYTGDTIQIKLNPPLIDHEQVVVTDPVPLHLKHFIPGVAIRYTTDGSEPDSLTSPLFTGGVSINRSQTIKARAFKKGWISSETAEKQFFRAGIRPDSAHLLSPADPQYSGNGSATLIDAQKGDINFRSGMWLGFRNKPMELLLFFSKSCAVQSLALSFLEDVNGYILPPKVVEVWGTTGKGGLTLLARNAPVQPKGMASGKLSGVELSFPATTVTMLKLVVRPVPVLPGWHPGTGQRAWVFADEIFIN